MRILLIDNYDSFTYLLVTYLKELGQDVTVVTEADALAEQVKQSPAAVQADYQAIVISPGPKTPKEAAFSRQVVTTYAGHLPILGVCLGHQVIADVFGGQVIRGDRPQHGVTSTLTHTGQGLMTGLPQNFQVARYHSLIVTALPAFFCVDARSEDGVIQAMHHQTLPIWSVQFHPESWMTAHGYDILNNFLERVQDFEKFKRDNANIWDIFLAHYRQDEEIVFLYTSQPEASEHFSILAHAPFATVTQRDGVVRINQAKTTLSFSEAVDTLRTTKLPELSDWPIQPEILGFVSYEGDPARFSLYDELMLFDHETQELYVAQFEQTDQTYWVSATSPLPKPQKVPAVRQPAAIFMDQTRQEYMASVEKMRAHMAAGDLYVGNLTQQFDILSDAEPISVFQALATQNPAPFASFLHYPDWEMTQISSSVERFVAIHDRELTTKPIKGTIARGQTPEEDAQNLAKLADNTKDHAELLMVTDLLRNDVARISEPGHLVVKKFAAVETFAHVHQLVTTIQSRVKADLTFTEFMTAMFPGGSITGTPKKSAQAVIASLEKRPRGIYTGMQGWLNRRLDLDMNIAIRTLVFDGQTYRLGVGGGVTYESDAAAEFDEIVVKAQPFLAVFGIETLPTPIFTTGQVKDGQLCNLSAHVARLARQYHQPDLATRLQTLAAQSPDGVLRVSTDGDTFTATTRPLPPLVGPYRVKLADEAIAPSVLTQYKLSGPTFQKAFHPEVVHAKTQGYQDVLFHTDGFVTELSIGNFLAKRGDTYVTPSAQALPGTYLAEFSKTHHVIYAEIPVSELVNFEAFYMTNAVRGLVAIDLVGI